MMLVASSKKRTPNRLIEESSPYLLQHAYNPVDWYPWGPEAFEKAKAEDKPVFLSIGYSTCHWCHVMAHESFEDPRIAELLNRNFVSIKVDKEERPDIDSIYMSVCQAFTGSGGWPTSIFMTPDQKPFFAGTYFPKTAQYGMPGMKEVLTAIHDKWIADRGPLLESAETLSAALNKMEKNEGRAEEGLLHRAFAIYQRSYDSRFGGFGPAPKFPSPHNLLFLLTYYEKYRDPAALKMVEVTLMQMYFGGIFDHIGGGFSRYSTDRYFLVPHFEKMLYDNALLILAYCKAYEITKNDLYLDVAEKTAAYIFREMTSPEGGFYSAQDADSDGKEGKYYVFQPREILQLLGESEGKAFNEYFGITEKGNFEGKSIPNLLGTAKPCKDFDQYLPKIYEYRKNRTKLHTDDKILTSWNSLMIAALCHLYRASGKENYLLAARKARAFIEASLREEDILYVSFRKEKRGEKGFLDEYAYYIFALLALYDASLESASLEQAKQLCTKVIRNFYDWENGGFYFCGKDSEPLICRPKETFDGAIPCGNSLMAYNLVRLCLLTDDGELVRVRDALLDFLGGESNDYPTGHSMFLMVLAEHLHPPKVVTAVMKEREELKELPFVLTTDSLVKVRRPTGDFPLKGDRTTFYVCENHSCRPPVNELYEL
ncbi:MAG: thioredoxin domain-containing protein [Firmicutes bacterium]|nr:thioredoxin domain-containing protein [Bacillota bacterium]